MAKPGLTRNLFAGAAVGGVIGVIAAIGAFVRPALLERGEFWTYDQRARRAAHPERASKDIVIVDIDENDIDSVENNLGLSWPWPRSLFGYIAQYASHAGARVVMFDWLFQDRGVYSTNDAEEFAAAMAESKRAVFGLVLTREKSDFRVTEGRWAAKLATFPTRDEARAAALRLMAWNTRVFVVADDAAGATATTVYYGAKAQADEVQLAWQRMSAAEEIKDMFRPEPDAEPEPPAPRELTDAELAAELRGETIVHERDGFPLRAPGGMHIPHRAGLEPPLAILAGAAARLGIVHYENEADGIMRRHTLLLEHEGRYYPSLALAAYLVGHPGVTPALAQGELVLGDRKIPIDTDGKYSIRFLRSEGQDAYPHIRAYDILRSQAEVDEGKPPTVPAAALAGKYVIVSASAHALRDMRVSPVARVHLGAEIQANALDNLLSGQVIRRASPWLDALVALLLAALLASVMVATWNFFADLKRALAAITVLTAATIGGYYWLADQLYDRSGLWLAVVTPSTGAVMATFASLLVASSLERRGRRFVQEALGRYTSDELVSELMAHPEHLSLEWGEKRAMSVYFSDIAGFTSFSETLPPERLVKLLNDYLTQMTEIVLAHGGVIDKYIGDAIMAFWGAPLPVADHARRAVLAALEMRRKCDELRPIWQAEYGTVVIARAGVNSGHAVVGNMGSRHKYNYTVMGDMVNLASRLEGANKPYGTTLMISEFTYAQVKDVVEVRLLDLLAVKGKEQPVTVYEVLAEKGRASARELETVRRYHEALALYRARDFVAARAAFQRALEHDPADGPSKEYVDRCNHFAAQPPAEPWDGVWHMKEK